jgi:hypothetical protein
MQVTIEPSHITFRANAGELIHFDFAFGDTVEGIEQVNVQILANNDLICEKNSSDKGTMTPEGIIHCNYPFPDINGYLQIDQDIKEIVLFTQHKKNGREFLELAEPQQSKLDNAKSTFSTTYCSDDSKQGVSVTVSWR